MITNQILVAANQLLTEFLGLSQFDAAYSATKSQPGLHRI